MQQTWTRLLGITIASVLMLVSSLSLAQQAASAQSKEDRARDYFTNLELINQDGETVRFFDDVLKDKVVVINFIFSNCEGACPLMTHKLSLVRDRMEGQVGDPLRFVSLSIDPTRDTPAAMKEFAKTHHADHDGWVFLTGKPENLEHIIKRLGQYTDEIEAHSTMMLAGNVNAAHWIKILPHEQPPAIAEKLQLLIRDNETS
ncbi:MAG: SCO family protein [Gammaproteobacteria bacterium]|nr:SCO family protein [Gammaproteobacteria bacterium]